MMISVLCCIFILCESSILLKRKICELIPLFMCGLVMMLYGLAIVEKMSLIQYFLVAISVSLIILIVCANNRKKIDWEVGRKNILNSGTYVTICLIIICIVTQIGRRVVLFDEFNYWATSVKSLWLNDGLPAANKIWAIWEYPIAMPVIEWFGCYIYGNYNEACLYVMRLIFDVAFIVPIVSNLKVRWYKIPFIACLLYLGPSILNSTIYTMLSVDGDMALVFGYTVYCILDKKEKNSLYYYVRIIGLLSVIAVIKTLSILWVCYALFLFVIKKVIDRENTSSSDRQGETICVINMFLVPVVVYKIWTLVLQFKGYTSTRVAGRATNFLDAFLNGTWEWTGYEGDVLLTFIKAFFTKSISTSVSKIGGYNGVITPAIVVVLIYFLLVCLYKKNYIKRGYFFSVITFWTILLASYTCVFLLTLCTMFVGEIVSWTKVNIMGLAIGRYCAPVYLGAGGAIIFSAFTSLNKPIELTNKNKRFLLVLFILSINPTAIIRSLWFVQKFDENMVRSVNKLDVQKEELPVKHAWINNIGMDEARILYLGWKNLDVFDQYNLLPMVIQKPNVSYSIYEVGDLQDYIYEYQYDYVYYADDTVSQGLVDLCSQMLTADENMEVGTLYKIDKRGIKFYLEKVE